MGGFGFALSASIGAPGAGVDPIIAIFADGTDGFYFDFSKTDRLFKESIGPTLVSAAGDKIGLGLEGHSWGGKTLTQLLAAQGQLAINGDFASGDFTGWSLSSSPTLVIEGGAARVTSPSVSVSSIYQDIAVSPNTWYEAKGTVLEVSGGGAIFFYGAAGFSNSLAVFPSVAAHRVFINPGASSTIRVRVSAGASGGTTKVDDISLKKVPGNHGLQATTAAQPKYQTGGLARFDGSDDSLLTTLVPASAFTFLFKLKLTASAVGTQVIAGAYGAADTRCYLAFQPDGTIAAGLGAQSASKIKGVTSRAGQTGVACFTFDGVRCELLWNAVREYEGAQSGSISTAFPIIVGGWNNGGIVTAFAAVDIYHALAIKKALTAAEIAAITNLWGTT